jgi:hypothetical protein
MSEGLPPPPDQDGSFEGIAVDSFDDLREERVRVDISDDYMELRTSSDASFKAWVDEDRVAHLIIRSIRSNGSRDPYFERHRMGELSRRAIQHFDRSTPLEGLAFDWGKPPTDVPGDRSDNYSTYLATRNELLGQMDEADAMKQAALKTWTFRHIALPLHFSEIDTIVEVGDPTAPVSVKGVVRRRAEATIDAETAG